MVANARRWPRAAGWIHPLVVAAGCLVLLNTYALRVVSVRGFSMAPTLEDGDRLLVDDIDYEVGDPQVGDIAVLDFPPDPALLFIKRVIAVAGDTIRVTSGRAYVNGRLMCDDDVPLAYRGSDDFGPELVAPGYYFVMGDHRNVSWDSREWGLVPRRYILGKVRLRWWPIARIATFR